MELQGITDEAKRARLRGAHEKASAPGAAAGHEALRRASLRSPAAQFRWLQQLRRAAGPVARHLGLPVPAAVHPTDPYRVCVPRARPRAAARAPDLRHLFGALLEAVRRDTRDGLQVYGLLRRLTAPAGHPFGGVGAAVVDAGMHRTCLTALLQRLGMPGPMGEEPMDFNESECDAREARLKRLVPLRDEYRRPEKRREVCAVLVAGGTGHCVWERAMHHVRWHGGVAP